LGAQVPDLPGTLARAEFMHTSGLDAHLERRNEATPPFFKYMRTKLVGAGGAGW